MVRMFVSCPEEGGALICARSVRMKAQITYDTGETGVIERELALKDL